MVQLNAHSVSPVWYSVERKEGGEFKLLGGHDVDQGWMSQIRDSKCGKVVPRFSFQAWTRPDYQAFHFSEDSEKEILNLTSLIASECRLQNFDGLVIEHSIPFTLGPFVKALKTSLEPSLQLILVWPPLREHDKISTMANAAKLKELSEWVDGFSLMTYDHSNPSIPGPNAPMEWVEEAVNHVYSEEISSKIFLGLNFYGYDYIPSQYKMEAITGPKYLELLRKHEPHLIWDAPAKEAFFTYVDSHGQEHQVWYPTLKSLHERIKYAENQNLGISIWEIGQGLKFFFDLL